jgi:hypothetical protein
MRHEHLKFNFINFFFFNYMHSTYLSHHKLFIKVVHVKCPCPRLHPCQELISMAMSMSMSWPLFFFFLNHGKIQTRTWTCSWTGTWTWTRSWVWIWKWSWTWTRTQTWTKSTSCPCLWLLQHPANVCIVSMPMLVIVFMLLFEFCHAYFNWLFWQLCLFVARKINW